MITERWQAAKKKTGSEHILEEGKVTYLFNTMFTLQLILCLGLDL